MWYTCISGYRKRTPHFRLLPMVKCPLDCFLVYSFLLDVEQAKIRHAPFGTFAFSDKPLRNPSEHSDFWYIQGRIFSSCGLSETQGLPRSLVRFRAHRGEQVKEGSQMALFPFISLSMRLPFSRSRTSPYATLHNLPAIWCKSGVVVGVVDFRPKCPVYRSDLQRNGLWLPWWLPRKSPSWC